MPDGGVPDELLRALLDKSCALVLNGFSKRRQREILGLSACGMDCSACPLQGDTCAGCNAACGKVFHMPRGVPCPIYACCVNRHHLATCKGCREVPCDIWRATRDPGMTDQAFEASIRERVNHLKGE